MRRRGRTYLVLILPDGSKSMIPAEWTDFPTPARFERESCTSITPTLASVEDLLLARAIVDALLSRSAAYNSEPRKAAAGKESAIAKESESLRSSSQ
jgi:hypothetical protein